MHNVNATAEQLRFKSGGRLHCSAKTLEEGSEEPMSDHWSLLFSGLDGHVMCQQAWTDTDWISWRWWFQEHNAAETQSESVQQKRKWSEWEVQLLIDLWSCSGFTATRCNDVRLLSHLNTSPADQQLHLCFGSLCYCCCESGGHVWTTSGKHTVMRHRTVTGSPW